MRLIISLTLVLCGIFSSQLAMAMEVSGPAHDFTLKSNSGKNMRMDELRGQVVLLNFWASWCGPCRQEMPLLDDLHKRYEKLGFTVIGVNIDDSPDTADKILKDIPVSFPVLYDTGSTVASTFDVDAMPTTILIDRDGNMRHLHRGFKSGYEKEYQKQVKSLIRE